MNRRHVLAHLGVTAFTSQPMSPLLAADLSNRSPAGASPFVAQLQPEIVGGGIDVTCRDGIDWDFDRATLADSRKVRWSDGRTTR